MASRLGIDGRGQSATPLCGVGDSFYGFVDGERGMQCDEGEGSPVEVTGRDSNGEGVLIDRGCLTPTAEFLLHIFCGCLNDGGYLVDSSYLIDSGTNILSGLLHGEDPWYECLTGSVRGCWRGQFGLLLLGLLGLGIGSLSYALALAIRDQGWLFWTVHQTLLFPLMILSGMFLPLDEAPGWMRILSTANPLTHVVNSERDMYWV